jgi:hypothetical protein
MKMLVVDDSKPMRTFLKFLGEQMAFAIQDGNADGEIADSGTR